MARYYSIAKFPNESLVDVPCAVCSNTNSRTIGHDNGFIIRKCSQKDCGFVYVSPRPTAQMLRSMYLSYYPNGEIVPDKWKWEMRSIFLEVMQWLALHGKKGRILDIGCSFGHLLMELEQQGWQTVGIEPSTSAAGYAKKHIKGEVLALPFEDVNLEPESFDALVSLYVLEHVFDPRQFLEKCYRLLRRNCQAIIRIPRTEPLMPIQRLLMRPLMYAPMHLNDFSPRTMRKLSLEIGFRDIAIRVGQVRHSHDLIEHAGALFLGNLGRTIEILSQGNYLFPFTGSLSYILLK